jgi:hypothetical protein
VEGGLQDGGEGYAHGTWIRLPAGEHAELSSGRDGATVYVKTGHLVVGPSAGTR